MTTITLKQFYPAQTASLYETVNKAWTVVSLWSARSHQRKELLSLSAAQLLDLGITRKQAQTEAAKPFWNV